MLQREPVVAIFADARTLNADALAQMQQGHLRNAAEKAWGAARRAAAALILARNGSAPRTAGQAARSIRALARSDPAFPILPTVTFSASLSCTANVFMTEFANRRRK